MLSSIRKVQRTVLIIVAVLISITMVWFGTSNGNQTMGNVALTVYGKDYRPSEVIRMANLFNLAQDLGRSGSFELFIFSHEMYGSRRDQEIDRTNFVTRLIVMRNEARRLGVEPSPEEIAEKFRSLATFKDEQGEFSETKVEDYIRILGGRLSLNRSDIEQLVKDVLTQEKLKKLAGAGMKPTQWQVSQQYEQDYEQFTGYEIFLKEEDYTKGIEITDEAIKAHYEENKAQYLSPEKRAIDYIAFPLPPVPEEEDDPAATPAEEKEDEKADPKAEEEEGLTPEQWSDAFNKIKGMANGILNGVREGETFEKAVAVFNKDINKHNLALKYHKIEGLQLKSVGPFPMDADSEELPEGFAEELGLMSRVFTRPEIDIESEVIDAAQTRTNVYLYRLTEIVKPAELSLEDARELVVDELTRKEITKRLEDAAKEVKTKLLAELAKAETVEAALKAAGVEATYIKPFSKTEPATGSEHAATVSSGASEMKAGEIGDPHPLPDGLALFYLADRKLPERASREADEKRIYDSARFQSVEQAYNAWFDKRLTAANAEYAKSRTPQGDVVTRNIEWFTQFN